MYSGNSIQLISENEDIAFNLPVEGTSGSQYDFGAKNSNMSYKFMDIHLEAETPKAILEFVYSLSPNFESIKS